GPRPARELRGSDRLPRHRPELSPRPRAEAGHRVCTLVWSSRIPLWRWCLADRGGLLPSRVRPVPDQFQQVAVGIEKVEALVIAPVDRRVMWDASLGEDGLGHAV